MQHAVVRRRPLIQVRLDPVRIPLQKSRQLDRCVRPCNVGRAQQTRNHRSKRRRRISRRLLPSFLLRHRSILHQEGRRSLHKRKDAKRSQHSALPQPPRQHDREGLFIQLNAMPVRRAVDPEVLRKASIRTLRAGQVHQRAQRRIFLAAGQQRRRRLHHVPRPHQVIAAKVVIAPRGSPRNRRRGDKRARIRLVFMRQQHVMADPRQPALVRRLLRQPLRRRRPSPLQQETLQVVHKRRRQALQHSRQRRMMTVPKGDRDRKLTIRRPRRSRPSPRYCHSGPVQTASSCACCGTGPGSHRSHPRIRMKIA